MRDGKAHIIDERCIDSGECIRVCPKGAKKSLSDPLSLMDGYDVRAALPAPFLYGQFGSGRGPAEVDAVFSFKDIFMPLNAVLKAGKGRAGKEEMKSPLDRVEGFGRRILLPREDAKGIGFLNLRLRLKKI